MKRKYFIFILLLLPILVLAEPNSEFTINESMIEVGKSIKATVTLSDVAEWDIKIEDTGSSSCTLKEKDRTNDSKNTTKIFNLECMGAKEGTMVLNLSGSITDETGFKKEISNSKTITVYRVKSGENHLSVLKVDGQIIPEFDEEKNEYTLKETTNKSIRLEATTQDVNAKVEGIGNIDLKYGMNTIKVVVTAENESTRTYTVNINRIDNRDTNTNLKSLTVNNEKIQVENGTSSYTVKFEHNVNEIVIAAEAESAKATIKGTGTKKINDYANEFTFTVTAENETTKTYTVRVLRKDKDGNFGKLSDDNTVKNITIKDQTIKFDPEVKKYNILVENLDKVEIEVVTNDNSATVKIENNSNFKDGLNKVNIIVSSESGKENSYLLNVYKITDTTGSVTKKDDKKKKETKTEDSDTKKKVGMFWLWFALIELAILVLIFLTQFDLKQFINNPNEPEQEKNKGFGIKEFFEQKIRDLKDKIAEYKPVEPVSTPEEKKVEPMVMNLPKEEEKEEEKPEQKVVETEIKTEVKDNGTKETTEVPKEETEEKEEVEETKEEPKEEKKETSKGKEDTEEDPMKDISKSINDEINKTILGDKKEEK